ncbi:MAG: hypothetical protein ACR2GF_03305 [Acidimicrobiales bacterium]
MASLVTVAALGWAYTIAKADPMSSMVMGLGHVGRKMAMGMSVPGFLAMWAAMIVAMMTPTLGPMAMAYQKGPSRRCQPRRAYRWPRRGVLVRVVGGAVLAGVGALQFSQSKVGCLRACRTPVHTLNEGMTGGARW